ncbi:MAG TPA: pyridoxal phosphate-dependent aminotransferase [Methanomicrobia archaeon]|nr:pyridoxal phosphate-dependent aminotransferase [Methanomicrobia archaeon]HEX59351.1 pyridoxal phosphate-dependent aminotransferase [Methanomicrobia archaeon]
MRAGLASRIKAIEISGIRRAFEAASGEFINLGLGEPDFDTPQHIKEAAIAAIKDGFTSYTFGKGIEELREAISEKLREENGIDVTKDEIIVTSGASEALHIAIHTLVERGDEVLIPDPGFVSYANLVKLAEGAPVSVPLRKEDMTMDVNAASELISERTKAIILNSPANPTGAVLSKEDVRAFAELAEDHNLLIISDEVYEKIIYEGEHASPASFYENVVTVNAVSKTYAMTGWRLGYLAAPRSLVEEMLKIHQYIQACASSISQKAALAALTGPQDCVAAMVREFRKRRDFVVEALERLGLEFAKPKGAFYVFPEVEDEDDFVERMRRRGVIVTPGSAFGKYGKNHVRISYAASLEDLKEAFARMEDIINR